MVQSIRMAPPSAEVPRIAPIDLPIVGDVFSGRLTLSPSAESSSIIRLGVEHLTLWCVAPLSGVIFLNQQY